MLSNFAPRKKQKKGPCHANTYTGEDGREYIKGYQVNNGPPKNKYNTSYSSYGDEVVLQASDSTPKAGFEAEMLGLAGAKRNIKRYRR